MRLYGIQTTVSMAEIAHSQRLLRVRLVCRGCKFRPFSHANSPRLSIVCVYAWRFWPIVSAFVFSQRQLSLSASMHNTPGRCTGVHVVSRTVVVVDEGGGEFDAICLQETWLSEDSDKSLLCMEDYALISLGKTCSTRGGLIIYLKENLKYKMLDMSLKSNIWEGQFIEIYEDSKNVPKTDPSKTDIVYPTIYNWNGRLNDHNRFSMQLILFG